MELAPILLEYGPLGVMVVGLAWYARAERAERKEAQKNNLELALSMKDAINELTRVIERGQ